MREDKARGGQVRARGTGDTGTDYMEFDTKCRAKFRLNNSGGAVQHEEEHQHGFTISGTQDKGCSSNMWPVEPRMRLMLQLKPTLFFLADIDRSEGLR